MTKFRFLMMAFTLLFAISIPTQLVAQNKKLIKEAKGGNGEAQAMLSTYYFKGIEGDFSYIKLTSQFYLEQEQINNFKEYVKVVYNNLGLEPNYNTFPISFTSQLIPADIFLNSLELFIDVFILSLFLIIPLSFKSLLMSSSK